MRCVLNRWPTLQVVRGLVSLGISGNGFSGTFPGHLHANADKLQVPDLRGNDLTGELPSEIPMNPSMRFLSLSDNRFDGSIPRSLNNLTRLRHLNMSDCQFSGDLPAFLSESTELSHLDLSKNRFSNGSFPESFRRLTKLRWLSLEGTNLTAGIPPFTGGYSKMILLDLGNNNLSGTIPESIGSNTNLWFLSLGRNPRLEGTVPESLSQLSSLRVALFDRTGITGSLNGLCQLPAFRGAVGPSGFLSADCGGSSPRVICACCNVCCDPTSEDQCYADDEVAESIRPWELVLGRNAHIVGSNKTYFSGP